MLGEPNANLDNLNWQPPHKKLLQEWDLTPGTYFFLKTEFEWNWKELKC